MIKRSLAVLPVLVVLGGCASLPEHATHPMKIETARADGTLVGGASCELTNDYGTTAARSGETTQVRRSSRDLDITCRDASNPAAVGRAISRPTGGTARNFLTGSVAAIMDRDKGTTHTYPTWVRLVFGQTLIFDRNQERNGLPVVGLPPGQARP